MARYTEKKSQTNIRLPEDLKAEFAELGEEIDSTISSMTTRLIEAALEFRRREGYFQFPVSVIASKPGEKAKSLLTEERLRTIIREEIAQSGKSDRSTRTAS